MNKEMRNNNVLLMGNGVNRINDNDSWEKLLKSLVKFCGVKYDINDSNNEQFSLFYEKVYLKSNNIDELDIKKHIASEVKNIKPNEIHSLIKQKSFTDIITTNYDYTLQENGLSFSKNKLKSQGIVRESKFSVFRHNIVDDKKFWHIHGECNVPQSINLGYEHYSGQLQKMRNYVISGTDYKYMENKESLTSKIRNEKIKFDSWIDLFFTQDIHIVGLALDFVEIDLWWLLTYRARLMKFMQDKITNKIYYYINSNCENNKNMKNKQDLLLSMGVEIIEIKEKEWDKYYRRIFEEEIKC